MKKIFTLIAAAMISAGAFADTTPVTYTFDNQAATYVLGEQYAKATTATLDDVEGFAVDYTGAGSDQKMQVKLAANQDVFFEYSNSSNKSTIVKTAPTFFVANGKGFVLNIPVETGDVIYVKYSAKGDTKAVLDVYGEEPCITANEAAVKECAAKTEAEAVVFSATASKGGTAKVKETSGGMRVYSISINQEPTAINEVAATSVKANNVVKTVNGIVKNGKKYNFAGQQVK